MHKIIALTLLATTFAMAEDFIIVQDGKAVCKIAVDKNAPPALQRGALELQTYIDQMSGAKLEIVPRTETLPEAAIVVMMPEKPTHALGDDGFVLKRNGSRLFVAGYGSRGALYGCTDVLEKLGVRWFTPKVTVVPEQATLKLVVAEEVQKPSFEYREPYFTEAWDKDWAARLRIVGSTPRLTIRNDMLGSRF